MVTASAFSADTLGPVGPVGGERKVVDGRKRILGFAGNGGCPPGNWRRRIGLQRNHAALDFRAKRAADFVLNGGAAIVAIVYLIDSSSERRSRRKLTIKYSL